MQHQHSVQFKSVRKTFGNETVISSLDLEIASGERLVLLGPSGCGKTTIMRLIAGLEQPVSGEIYMGGKRMNGIDASERNVAMVFQNYALYPHMSVFDNIAFSLKLRKQAKAEITRRIREVADKLELGHLLDRKPRELSGGQRQRVALCRAIVQQSPYFLLDEPLSNLDAQLRTNARNELVELHEAYPATMVYVTHDQVEAMTIGQRIAVLKKGHVQQVGTPDDIYNRPANRFVATFIGNPPMNVMPIQVIEEGMLLAGQVVPLPHEVQVGLKQFSAKPLQLGVRPEAMTIHADALASSKPHAANVVFACKYVRSEYLGAVYVHHLAAERCRFQVASPYPVMLRPQANVVVSVPIEQLHFFTVDESEKRIPLTDHLTSPLHTAKPLVASLG